MSAISSNMTRVPVALSSKLLLDNLTRTSNQLMRTQLQMSSGSRIIHPSDDVVSSTLTQILDSEMERRSQRMNNLDAAERLINISEQLIGSGTDLVIDAKTIAMSMIGPGVDSETRKSEAEVVNSLIDELYNLANSKYNNQYLFGGQATADAPLSTRLNGYAYNGTREGMQLALGIESALPVTIAAHEAFGALSGRVQGDRDITPALTGNERVSDIAGARGLDITLGNITLNLNSLDEINVDLSGADSIQDIIDLIDNAISEYETDNSVTLLGTDRVGFNTSGTAISIDVAAGVTITINDEQGGVAAEDLGLSQAAFTTADNVGEDLVPCITEFTQLTDMAGITVLSDFVISNAGQARTIEASGAETIQDLMNLVKRADIGVRLEIDDDGQRLNLINELSGSHMGVYEVTGGTMAEDLGIRTLNRNTRLADLNDGKGVDIISGSTDPDTGDPAPDLDLDFRVTLRDGTYFDVDLAGAVTVGDVMDTITAAAPATFSIAVDDDGPDGLILTDLTGGTGRFSVESLNRSEAAQDLGITASVYSATITGENRAMVEVDSVFTHLIALRDALMADSEVGITIAGEKLEADINRFAQIRGILGERANRVVSMRQREEDRQVLDQIIKSQVKDLDYAEAGIRFTTLQTQLQAAMMTGAQAGSLSLIRFLQ